MAIYGLLGESLKHSISPRIHSLIFEEINIQGTYELFEVDEKDLKDAINKFKTLGVAGVNVTIPYKTRIMEYIDDVSLEAKNIGSVNTICFKDKGTIGYNTDYAGFGMLLKKNEIDICNKKAVILGSGGAAKAVIQYLLDKGIGEITIVSREVYKTETLYNKKEFNFISYQDISCLKEKDFIINCTPCGMYPIVDQCPIEKSHIDKFSTAIDLIYNPEETLLLKYAREQGGKAVNGLYMLIGQAVYAEELWHDIKIDKSTIDKVYEALRYNKHGR